VGITLERRPETLRVDQDRGRHHHQGQARTGRPRSRHRIRDTPLAGLAHIGKIVESCPSAADVDGHPSVAAYAESVTARNIASDFINETYLALLEERPLWELPRGTTDLLADGPVRHGPWEPRACAELIIRWLDRGWVELYLPDVPSQWNLKPAGWQVRTERRGAFSILDPSDARQLLEDWRRWTVDSADGQASLSRTDVGMNVVADDWLAETTV
jgi:hypothetical protein